MSQFSELDRLKKIFSEAARKSTGAAKPKLVKLSKAFDAYCKARIVNEPEDLRLAQLAFDKAVDEVDHLAETDLAARKIFIKLVEALEKKPKDKNPPEKPVARHWYI